MQGMPTPWELRVSQVEASNFEAALQDLSICGDACPAVMEPFKSQALGSAVSALQEGLWDVWSTSDARKLKRL